MLRSPLPCSQSRTTPIAAGIGVFPDAGPGRICRRSAVPVRLGRSGMSPGSNPAGPVSRATQSGHERSGGADGGRVSGKHPLAASEPVNGGRLRRQLPWREPPTAGDGSSPAVEHPGPDRTGPPEPEPVGPARSSRPTFSTGRMAVSTRVDRVLTDPNPDFRRKLPEWRNQSRSMTMPAASSRPG